MQGWIQKEHAVALFEMARLDLDEGHCDLFLFLEPGARLDLA